MSSKVDESVDAADSGEVAGAASSTGAADSGEVAKAVTDTADEATTAAADTVATGATDPDDVVDTATDAAGEATNAAGEATNAADEATNAADEAVTQATESTGGGSGSGDQAAEGTPAPDAGQVVTETTGTVTETTGTVQAQVDQAAPVTQGAEGAAGGAAAIGDAAAGSSSLPAGEAVAGVAGNGASGLGKAGDAARNAAPDAAPAVTPDVATSDVLFQAKEPASALPSPSVASGPAPVDAVSPAAGDAGGSVGSSGFEPGAVIDALAGGPLAGHAGTATTAGMLTLAGIAAWRVAPIVSSYAGCYVPGALGAGGSAVRGLLSARFSSPGTPAAAAAREALVVGARTVGAGSQGTLSAVAEGASRLRLPAIVGTLEAPPGLSPRRVLTVVLLAMSAALYAAAALPGRVLRFAGLASVPVTYRFYASVAGFVLLAGAAMTAMS